VSLPEQQLVPSATAVVPAPTTLVHRAQSVRALVTKVWLPHASWSIGRTGRSGLAGIALLVASLIFFGSTQLQVADDIAQRRADLQAAERAPAKAETAAAEPQQELRNLPARSDIPQMLGQLLQRADDAQLSIDTAKYEIAATKAGSVVRYRLSFPVDGSYPQIRKFIDSVLVSMPAVAVDEIAISRKSVGDNTVEAQLQMTIFTKGAP
jgi:Tfp pilus assembly protein PilO